MKNVKKMKTLTIRRFQTPNYRSYIEITEKNRNYVVLRKIDEILKNNRLQWNWFFKRINIERNTLKTYISGAENISMLNLEKIALILKPYINSPKEIINPTYPILTLGKDFKLNLGYILQAYNIRQHEVAYDLNIDSAWVSMVARGKTSRISPGKLFELYNYLRRRGVPLRNVLDLIYFPNWSEGPGDFIKKNNRKNTVFKYNSALRA